MTRYKNTLKAAAAMSALALTIAAAPSAFAGDSTYSKLADRVASKSHAQRHDRGNRADRGSRRSDRGTRSNERRSSYRWAPSSYAFYRPGLVSYASYRNRTRCERVIVDGFQYGTLRPVSIKQCYNPWDGYYIIQGSERIARSHW